MLNFWLIKVKNAGQRICVRIDEFMIFLFFYFPSRQISGICLGVFFPANCFFLTLHLRLWCVYEIPQNGSYMLKVTWEVTNVNKAVNQSKEKKLDSQRQMTLQNFNCAGVNIFPWFAQIKEIKASMRMFKYYRSTGVLSWKG